jgi:molybdopterin-guanine dinucleotide biosynthesis protein A
LPFGDRNFLQIALDNARAVCPDPIIVGARSLYASYGPLIEDEVPGCGPLSGIHAALSTTKSELNLVLSVDMPLMTAEFLRWLLDVASACNDLAVVPEANGRTQPLCTVFRREALVKVDRALRSGAYKVDRLFSVLPTRFVSENEWRALGFSPDIFRNVNTPEEYEAVIAALEPASISIRGPQS